MVKNTVVEYQLWYQDKWPLAKPTKNKAIAVRYGKRLARAYGKGYIKIKKLS